jgi:hypothetical protein
MIRRALLVTTPVAVLGALVVLAPRWHLLMGTVAWLLVRGLAPDLARAVGRPTRWIAMLGLLAVLGAWLGPADHRTIGVAWSAAGAWSAATMVVRAFALVVLTSALTAAVPFRRWVTASRLPVVRRLVEVVVVATNLVPVLLRSLGDARHSLRERRPGLRRLPCRLRLLSIHAVVRAASLAEAVAFDMAIAAHNGAVSVPTSMEKS